ncbi:bacillithiol system redox-active protein YtxJ [Bacillus sp. HMF5848]|uniref:bacillithiol system redox-active protein YtxJ n=1 Tax=Bacillus sp. HMF5848 TaxID=2495421 RepID=UPI000F7B2949|nr:bacillithiol system redox-active protein YtxJ [Bacillus sp. HMF5848]RSK28204.1 bacillithiol system redox-active protein YtxJ [Bacillus sp. HMF5848]
MSSTKVTTQAELEQLIQEHGKLLVIKHSLTCPVSGQAFSEYESFTKSNSEVVSAYLYVQEARPLSNYIAETYNIKHESPQALLIKEDEVVWHTSHWKITTKSLEEAVK